MLHHAPPPHCLAVITAALLTTLTIAGCQSSVRSTTATSAASSSDDALTGTEGTADFDVGFVTIGSGHKVVDVFIDPMCSFCKHFEETSARSCFPMRPPA